MKSERVPFKKIDKKRLKIRAGCSGLAQSHQLALTFKSCLVQAEDYLLICQRYIDSRLPQPLPGTTRCTVLKEIRQASNQGMALGSDRFKQEVERLAGRRVVALKKGPKRKRMERPPSEFLL